MKKKKNGNKNNYSHNLDLAYERIAKERVEQQEKKLSTRARVYEEICSLVGEPTLLDNKGRIRFSFKQSVDFLIKKFNAFEVSMDESVFYLPRGVEYVKYYIQVEEAIDRLSEGFCVPEKVTKVLIAPTKWEYTGTYPPSKKGLVLYLEEENEILRYVWMSPLYKCCDAALEQAIEILATDYCPWEW